VSAVVAATAVVVFIPSVVAMLLAPTVSAMASPGLSQGVWLTIPPEKLPAPLTVWGASLSTIPIDEGQILDHHQVGEDLVGQGMLEPGWRLVVDLHVDARGVHRWLLSIRVGDGQPQRLRDLIRVCAPGPHIVRPCPLLAPSVLLNVVDGA